MRKILVIAAREYQASVKTKAFIISLVVMPLLMGGSILVQTLVKDVGANQVKRFAIVDRTGGKALADVLRRAAARASLPMGDSAKDVTLFQLIKLAAENPKTAEHLAGRKATFEVVAVDAGKKGPGDIEQLRFDLSERVRKGELEGFVEIGPDVFSMPAPAKKINAEAGTRKGRARPTAPTDADKTSKGLTTPEDLQGIRYQTNNPTNDAFAVLVQKLVSIFVQEWRFQQKHLDRGQIEPLLKEVPLDRQGLTRKDEAGRLTTAPPQNRLVAFLMPLGLIMLMFMVIMVGATPLIQGIVEEKLQRIAEVLLGSVGPFELMLGKLLGMVGVSLTLAAVYLIGAYWLVWQFGYTEYLTPDIIAWFLVYQALAVAMFGSLFIAIGAACTDTKETQTMVMPVMLLACVPLFVWNIVIQEPNSGFSIGLSFFPFATPMLMLARQAVPPGIPVWQPVAGVAAVLATTVLCVYAAGRIFRVGILMQGKGAKLGEMLRWVFRG
jgi:ABC-2 type transport system permease protein